jgi:hypothetical protein
MARKTEKEKSFNRNASREIPCGNICPKRAKVVDAIIRRLDREEKAALLIQRKSTSRATIPEPTRATEPVPPSAPTASEASTDDAP